MRGRHESFREALETVRLLWRGGYRSYQGEPPQLEGARVVDLPEHPPVIAVAASGPASARIAAELGDRLLATEPEGEMVTAWVRLGGNSPACAEVPLAWAPDAESAAQVVWEKSRRALTPSGGGQAPGLADEVLGAVRG